MTRMGDLIDQASFHVPSYAHWLHFEADLEPTFRYYTERFQVPLDKD